MPNNVVTLLFIPVMIIAFYFLLIRPQRKRQQEQQKLLREMTAGARVVTHSGIFGTLVSVGDKQAVIEIAPGVRLTVLRQAVVRTVGPTDEDGPADADESADEQADTIGTDAARAASAAIAEQGYARAETERTDHGPAESSAATQANPAAAPGFPAYRPAGEVDGDSGETVAAPGRNGETPDGDTADGAASNGGIRDVTDTYFARPQNAEGDRAPGDA